MKRPTLGFLYPGHAAEDDYPIMASRFDPPTEIAVVHTTVGEDAHRPDALMDIGRPDRLNDGVEALRQHGADVAIWACTSGSFVRGWDGAREQVARLAKAAGVPASSTSVAFVNALRALDARRVAIAGTYPPDVLGMFVEFLAHDGVETLTSYASDIITAAEVGTKDADWVGALVRVADHADADAILVPDTALNSAELVPDLEAALGKPVLTANQVTFWEALRLAGASWQCDSLGTLFRAPVPAV